MNLFQTQQAENKRYYFYRKRKNDFEAVELDEINVLALNKLADIFKKRNSLRIPRILLDNWDYVALFNSNGNIEKANSLYFIKDCSVYDLNNSLNDLSSKEWLSETVTVFTQKGLGKSNAHAQIEKQHPAPFSFQDVGRLIRFFTKEGDCVLDPFVGVASTLKACAVEHRIGYGFELNDKYYQLGNQRLELEISPDEIYRNKQNLLHGDCRDLLKKCTDQMFDFLITSPPYWNILDTVDHKVKQTRIADKLDSKYSTSEKDYGNIETYEDFINELSYFFDSCSRVLKSRKYMVVIVSDFRKKDKFYLFHSDLSKEIEALGNFSLKGVRILHQKFKSIYPYGYPFSFVPNIHHQYVLILQKNK
ncbi:MAG: site-specific DNA-methyltransferase [Sphingobacteriia bacterium]|nr:site-specific DNA-methyltransferase [Sphingobacteriia bacterium]